MLIVFDSMTGNVRSFVEKSGFPALPVSDKLRMDEPYILVTHTINFGEIPQTTKSFLSNNHRHLKGVASSGNRIWGSNFAIAGEKISADYQVPLLLKFELRGTKRNVSDFQMSVHMLTSKLNPQETR